MASTGFCFRGGRNRCRSRGLIRDSRFSCCLHGDCSRLSIDEREREREEEERESEISFCSQFDSPRSREPIGWYRGLDHAAAPRRRKLSPRYVAVSGERQRKRGWDSPRKPIIYTRYESSPHAAHNRAFVPISSLSNLITELSLFLS